MILFGIWIRRFLFFKINLDDPKESLMYRLSGALILLAWPFITIGLLIGYMTSRR